MVIHIPLSKTGKHAGKYIAIIDDCDSDLAELNWRAIIKKYDAYAAKSRKTVLLHRVVLERKLERPIKKGMECDHINRNKLDNRRENLREVTRKENQENSINPVGIRGVKSETKGVYWDKAKNKWITQLYINRKRVFYKGFNNREDAEEAYEKAFFSHFGYNREN